MNAHQVPCGNGNKLPTDFVQSRLAGNDITSGHIGLRDRGPGSSARSQAQRERMSSHPNTGTSFDIEMARGEGVSTRSSRGREHRAWRCEMGLAQRAANGEQTPYCSSHVSSTKKLPSPTYRTVLAKRGLIVKATLGAGSYSKVKHAVYIKTSEDPLHTRLPDHVAVKIIDRKSAPTDFQEKFLPRELETWPNLNHVNIVKMLECFTESHRVYMILEYVECGDALRFIQSKGAVSESTGKIWVHQVADAVRYLHELNITHRDLKLENLLIDRHNNIKICDFGFVRQCCETDLSKTFCGSKSYAAPEILKGEPYPPKKADIWAIGVILFILVTGRMPFDETKGNTSLLSEHRRLDLQWPRGRRSLTAQCKALSVFCLKFLWSDRPTIQQVLSHTWFKGQPPQQNRAASK